MRRAIVRAPERYLAMTASLADVGLALSNDDALSRVPRGFDDVGAPAIVDAVKRKSHICSRPVADDSILRGAFVSEIVTFAQDAKPLLEWGWPAIVEER